MHKDIKENQSISNHCLSEDLLNAWLTLSAAVRNERLVQTMTFREIFVCNILSHELSSQNDAITATDIVVETGMLKSQVNKVLTTLEQSGIISRSRNDMDKRQIHIALTEKGYAVYQEEHQRIIMMLDQLVEMMGADTISHFVSELHAASEGMTIITEKTKLE